MKYHAYFLEGGNEGGWRATPNTISIFDLFQITRSPPFLIPTLWNIDILLYKQAKRQTIMHTTVAWNKNEEDLLSFVLSLISLINSRIANINNFGRKT